MTWTPPKATGPNSSGQSSTDVSSGLADQTQQKVGQVVDQAHQTAGQVTEQAKQQATSQLESQKDRAVEGLVTVGQALRQTGQHLHEQQQNGIAGYMDQAAERVEGLTNHLRSRDVSELLAETEDIARRSPVLFLGAAAALGFVGARFLMSSGQRARAQRGYGAPSSQGQRGFGPPSQGQPGYGASPQGQRSFGPPSQGQPGFSPPAQGQPSHSAPAQGQPGHNAPSQNPATPGSGAVGGAPRLPVV